MSRFNYITTFVSVLALATGLMSCGDMEDFEDESLTEGKGDSQGFSGMLLTKTTAQIFPGKSAVMVTVPFDTLYSQYIDGLAKIVFKMKSQDGSKVVYKYAYSYSKPAVTSSGKQPIVLGNTTQPAVVKLGNQTKPAMKVLGNSGKKPAVVIGNAGSTSMQENGLPTGNQVVTSSKFLQIDVRKGTLNIVVTTDKNEAARAGVSTADVDVEVYIVCTGRQTNTINMAPGNCEPVSSWEDF